MPLPSDASPQATCSDKSRILKPITSSYMRSRQILKGSILPCRSPLEGAFRSNSRFGWTRHFRPEGKAYYYHPDARIVTEWDVQSNQVREAVGHWVNRIRTAANNCGITLTAGVEMVLDFEFSAHVETCTYYLIDWHKKREFWVEEDKASVLGLDNSLSGLSSDLQSGEQFWTHVESFCMHHPIPENADDKLLTFLRNSARGLPSPMLQMCPSTFQTRQVTSTMVRSPWTASESERILRLLINLRKSSGVKNRITARFWRMILHSQRVELETHSDDRPIHVNDSHSDLTVPSTALPLLYRVLLLNAPKPYHEALTQMSSDPIVCNDHWNTFVRDCRRDWKAISVMGLLLMAINCSTLKHKEFAGYLRLPNLVSTFLALLGSVSGALLTFVHQSTETYDSSSAVAYLERTRHFRFGHQRLAIVFSLPHVFFLWSLNTLGFAMAILFTSILKHSAGYRSNREVL